MPLEDLIRLEEKWQQLFDNAEMKFEPRKVLSVTILRCRNVSVNFLRDKLIDTPDPQFHVIVASFPKPNNFRTHTKRNAPTSEINEKFNFVFPPESSLKQSQEIEIKLYDDDIVCQTFIGNKKFDFSKFEIGKSYPLTLSFNGHGEVDIETKIEMRSKPDFRLGLGLHEDERKFRIKRIPIVYEALKNLIGPDAPRDVSETPIISLCTSGGGYRATAGMAGVMEAIKDHGLLDIFTYIGSLSGSGWYVESAYSKRGVKASEQEEFHDFLKTAMTKNFIPYAFQPSNHGLFRKYLVEKRKWDLPLTLVDFFGFVAGLLFLGIERLDTSLCELQDYIQDASLPLPILVSLHVKNDVTASQFHAYLESSPYECCFPTFGIGMDHNGFGAQWNSGIKVHCYPTTPTHYHLGVTGSAFAIYATTNIDTGEKEERLLSYVDKIRCQKQNEGDAFASKEESDEEKMKDEEDPDGDEDVGKDEDPKYKEESSWANRLKQRIQDLLYGCQNRDQRHKGKVRNENREQQSTSHDHGSDRDMNMEWEMSNDNEGHDGLIKRFMDSFVTSRDSLLGRTGKAFNFSLNFNELKAFHMSPCGEIPQYGPDKQELMDLIGGKSKQKMSTRKRTISLVDAGLYNNIPGVILLRPQRTTDFMLVVDFSSQPSDEEFFHLELFATAAHAWREGLKFPHVDFKKISGLPPTECLVFDDEGDDLCPIVVWITLANRKFTKLNDFKPRSGFKHDSTKTNFNDFSVFGPKSLFTTFRMGYNELDYERLKELMYFNVSSNIEVIKEAMIKAVAKRKRRIQRYGS